MSRCKCRDLPITPYPVSETNTLVNLNAQTFKPIYIFIRDCTDFIVLQRLSPLFKQEALTLVNSYKCVGESIL